MTDVKELVPRNPLMTKLEQLRSARVVLSSTPSGVHSRLNLVCPMGDVLVSKKLYLRCFVRSCILKYASRQQLLESQGAFTPLKNCGVSQCFLVHSGGLGVRKLRVVQKQLGRR